MNEKGKIGNYKNIHCICAINWGKVGNFGVDLIKIVNSENIPKAESLLIWVLLNKIPIALIFWFDMIWIIGSIMTKGLSLKKGFSEKSKFVSSPLSRDNLALM